MIFTKRFFFILSILFCVQCTEKPVFDLASALTHTKSIPGKAEYLDSPYVTAGNRVYMVGHQNGSFPDLGWHIKGEMGGIWNHPIKLMDGFEAEIRLANDTVALDNATSFVNYPFANQHHFLFNDKDIKVVRTQFVPDDVEGLVVQYTITNTGEAPKDITFVFTGNSDLRPTWLGERTQMVNGQDEPTYTDSIWGWIFKDSKNPWSACISPNLKPERKFSSTLDGEALTASGTFEFDFNLPNKGSTTISFAISGSYTSTEAATATATKLHDSLASFFETKKLRYQQLAQQARLTIPDKKMQQTFEWLKYNCDWLVRKVPEIGTGITAGIPDYPWWFGVDSEYALQGYMAIGQEDAVYKTIHLLDSVSEAVNGNGKIIHEMSTNGAVFNNGNINETPQFATLIWRIYQWNGDRTFLEKYFPTIEKGLDWLLKENDLDGNGFPEGFGMMEIHGLDSEMIDVAVYSQKAFDDASQMATILGKDKLAKNYAAIAKELKARINSEFWSEDFGSYADFIGTDEQALRLIDDAIVRADTLGKPWSITELKKTKQFIVNHPSDKARPFVLHHNWVVNTPMEMGIADGEKAVKALETAKTYVNPFGVFVTGIDRDNSAGSNENTYKAPPIFNYTGAVMTLPTGVSAIGENNYGRPNEALDYLERMTRSFSYALPGSMYEVSPDFGMMAQAWNIYSYAYPIVQQFFGIRPNAANKEVVIHPQMPDKWKEASLENIKIGDNEISIFYTMTNGKPSIKVNQTNIDWTLILKTSTTEKPKTYKGEITTAKNGTIIKGKGETVSITF